MSVNISLPEYFGYNTSDYFREEEEPIMEEIVTAIKREHNIDGAYDTAFGASKAVIIPEQGDYVWKFPFRGHWNYYEDEAEVKQARERFEKHHPELKVVWVDELTAFVPFRGAYCEEENWNYCGAEMEIFEEVPDEFKVFFAETTEEKIGDVVYYAQEKCVTEYYADEDIEIYEKVNSAKDRKISDKTKEENEWCGRVFNDDWLKWAEALYGEDRVFSFLEWLNSDGDIISDLHDENYGYSKVDGRPVLMDWAGYSN